jgi:uncharacterized membrane protein YeaQ/YmgE (transglycosylase-associated protein family)
VDLLELLILLVIAGICGAIAEFVVGFNPGGLLISIIVGVVGAYLGSWIAGLLHLPALLRIPIGGMAIDLLWSVIGSILLLLVLIALRGGRRYRFLDRFSKS